MEEQKNLEQETEEILACVDQIRFQAGYGQESIDRVFEDCWVGKLVCLTEPDDLVESMIRSVEAVDLNDDEACDWACNILTCWFAFNHVKAETLGKNRDLLDRVNAIVGGRKVQFLEMASLFFTPDLLAEEIGGRAFKALARLNDRVCQNPFPESELYKLLWEIEQYIIIAHLMKSWNEQMFDADMEKGMASLHETVFTEMIIDNDFFYCIPFIVGMAASLDYSKPGSMHLGSFYKVIMEFALLVAVAADLSPEEF